MPKDLQTKPAEEKRNFSIKQLIPIFILGAGLALFFVFDLDKYVTQETLRDNREWLLAKVAKQSLLTAIIFISIYIVGVAFSLPIAAILTIIGGFMFGQYLGTLYVVSGATIGATCLFLVAKTAFGDFLRAKAGPAVKGMEEGFRENELSYLLVLRLIPVFPFFIVNLVPAFLGVSLKNFLIGTFFGILPGSFVFVSVGAGIGSIFDQGKTLDFSNILTKEIITALIGLAMLALLPVVYKKIKARKEKPKSN